MRLTAFAAALLWAQAAFASTIWVESFETGVGRFDQTLGPGDVRHVWQENQSIRAFFVQDGRNDRRFAGLDQTYDVGNDLFGFGVTIEAAAASNGDEVSSGIGFWNTNDDFASNRLGLNIGIHNGAVAESFIAIDGRYSDGSPLQSSNTIPFLFFTDYFIDVVVDGPNSTVSADVFEGADAQGVFLGTLTIALDPGKTLLVDSLGMGAIDLGGEAIVLYIDNFAFTIPEPATLALFLIGGTLVARRRSG